jgi:hypothetical protein
VALKIEGDGDWLAGGGSGPDAGEAPDCLGDGGGSRMHHSACLRILMVITLGVGIRFPKTDHAGVAAAIE